MKKLLSFVLLFYSLSTAAQSDDEYTRYELQSPYTNNFRILYEVSATTPGAVVYHNALRSGSEHFVERVVDLATGKFLTWKIVHGREAKENGLASADPNMDYLQVDLAHPLPNNAAYRLQIDKTYRDLKSYYADDDQFVFERTIRIKRNSIVLPKDYELISCNYPSQVMMEADGRIKLSFINSGPDNVNLLIKGRKLSKSAYPPIKVAEPRLPLEPGRNKSKARIGYLFPEQANQKSEIVYFLQQPETNSFRLYHDYTETKVGVNKYVNVVRSGSKSSNPSAINLDTGQPLKVETLVGKAIKDKGIEIGSDFSPTAEAIVIWFDPVKKGTSTRIRIEETYTDPNRYIKSNNELIWDRTLGRVHNTVTLPEGWWLTASSMPATVFMNEEGLVSLYFMNDAPDVIDVFLKAMLK